MMTGRNGYSALQIALHWAIAALILFNYIVSDGMGRALDARLEGGMPPGGLTPVLHVYVGLAVLALVALRVLVRLTQGAPAAHDSGIPALNLGARLAHGALYLLMLAVPVFGALTWYGGIEDAGEAHEVAANLILILAGLHAAAALFHQYVLKDGLLVRMMRAG